MVGWVSQFFKHFDQFGQFYPDCQETDYVISCLTPFINIQLYQGHQKGIVLPYTIAMKVIESLKFCYCVKGPGGVPI